MHRRRGVTSLEPERIGRTFTDRAEGDSIRWAVIRRVRTDDAERPRLGRRLTRAEMTFGSASYPPVRSRGV